MVTVATDCRIKSNQLDAILTTLVVYDHLVVTIGPLLGGGGSLTRYLSLISFLSAGSQIATVGGKFPLGTETHF